MHMGIRTNQNGAATRLRTPVIVALLFVGGIAGVGVMLAATRHGSSLTSDSLIYINASRNLIAGRGISRLSGLHSIKPIAHYPPLLPLLLAGLQSVGLESLDAARALNALAFGMNVLLVGAILCAVTRRTWPTLLGMFFMLASPIMIDLHSWAMSEPLYLLWGLAAVLLLHAYGTTHRRFFLIVSATAAGCAYLTRYVGLSLVVTLLLALLADGGRNVGRRVADALTFLAISLTPMAVWMVRNLLTSGSATNYSFVWHPFSMLLLKRPFGLLWEWLFPFRFTYPALLIMVGVLFAAILLLLVLTRRGRWRPSRDWIKAISWTDARASLSLYVLCYSGSVALSILFLSATTPVDQRIAAPVYVALLVLLIAAVSTHWLFERRVFSHASIVALAVLLGASYVQRSVDLVRELWTESRGYASPIWRETGNLGVVRGLPADLLIYTNSFPALEFFYGRGSYMVPLPGDPVTQLAVPDYEERLAAMRRDIQEGRAVLILFFREPDGTELPRELAEGLEVRHRENGVSIWVGEEFDRLPDPGS